MSCLSALVIPEATAAACHRTQACRSSGQSHNLSLIIGGRPCEHLQPAFWSLLPPICLALAPEAAGVSPFEILECATRSALTLSWSVFRSRPKGVGKCIARELPELRNDATAKLTIWVLSFRPSHQPSPPVTREPEHQPERAHLKDHVGQWTFNRQAAGAFAKEAALAARPCWRCCCLCGGRLSSRAWVRPGFEKREGNFVLVLVITRSNRHHGPTTGRHWKWDHTGGLAARYQSVLAQHDMGCQRESHDSAV